MTGAVWRLARLAAGLFLVGFGVFIVMVGQSDDSPGLGGMGLVTVLIGAVILVRTFRDQFAKR